MPSDPFGVKELFECRQCGDCCKGFGGTYLRDADIAAISRFVDVNPESFVGRYCKLSGTKLVLGQRSDGYCIFWDKICLIHPVKPRMCRKWPFIQSILADGQNWRIMADSCPGINSEVPADRVQKFIQSMRPEK